MIKSHPLGPAEEQIHEGGPQDHKTLKMPDLGPHGSKPACTYDDQLSSRECLTAGTLCPTLVVLLRT